MPELRTKIIDKVKYLRCEYPDCGKSTNVVIIGQGITLIAGKIVYLPRAQDQEFAMCVKHKKHFIADYKALTK